MKYAITLVIFLTITAICSAHVSPPVKLASEQDVIQKLMPGLKCEAKDFRLAPSQRSEIQTKTGWKPSESAVRTYECQDQGSVKNVVVFLTEYTMHGSVRVAAACDLEGKLMGAEIVECSEESYNWVKPLMESDLLNYEPEKSSNKMTRYYGGIINKLVKNAPAVIEVLKMK